jgi:hypothetical protein
VKASVEMKRLQAENVGLRAAGLRSVLKRFVVARLPMRIPGSDPFDVRTANADVSQFTIGQVREFEPHRLVPPPSLVTAGDGSKHGRASFPGETPES